MGPRRFAAMLLLLALLLGACADVRDRVAELGGEAGELTERARFCLTVARALAATDAGAPDTAADAAEELLAQAPHELRDDARTVAEAVRAAREGDPEALEDPEVEAAVERLRDATKRLCTPGDAS